MKSGGFLDKEFLLFIVGGFFFKKKYMGWDMDILYLRRGGSGRDVYKSHMVRYPREKVMVLVISFLY